MIRISIIGAGAISAGYDNPHQKEILTHAHAISENGQFAISGFYDVDAGKSAEAVNKWGGRAFASVCEAVEEADAICVAVPDALHASVLRELLVVGNTKAIIMEKPLSTTLKEAEELQNLYDNSVPVLINYSRRYMEEFAELKKWIEEEAGTLLHGNCVYGKGTLHNCSHFIDLICYLLGKTEVRNTFGKIEDFSSNDPSVDFSLGLVDDSGTVYFHAIDSRLVTVFEMDLLFENGRIKYCDEEGIIEYYEIHKNALYPESNFKIKKIVSIDRSNAMRGLYSNLLNVIVYKAAPLCSFDDGLVALKIVDEIMHKENCLK